VVRVVQIKSLVSNFQVSDEIFLRQGKFCYHILSLFLQLFSTTKVNVVRSKVKLEKLKKSHLESITVSGGGGGGSCTLLVAENES